MERNWSITYREKLNIKTYTKSKTFLAVRTEIVISQFLVVRGTVPCYDETDLLPNFISFQDIHGLIDYLKDFEAILQ